MRQEADSGLVSDDRYIRGIFGDNFDSEVGSMGLDFCVRDSASAVVDEDDRMGREDRKSVV
jgi:hypothetical protein